MSSPYSTDKIIEFIIENNGDEENLSTFDEIKEQLERTKVFLIGFKQGLEELQSDEEVSSDTENMQKIDEKIQEIDEKIQQTTDYLVHMDKIKETGDRVRANMLLQSKRHFKTGGKKKTKKIKKIKKIKKTKKYTRR